MSDQTKVLCNLVIKMLWSVASKAADRSSSQKIIIINLIYIAQFDTNGILTALYIVITYIQMQCVHV